MTVPGPLETEEMLGPAQPCSPSLDSFFSGAGAPSGVNSFPERVARLPPSRKRIRYSPFLIPKHLLPSPAIFPFPRPHPLDTLYLSRSIFNAFHSVIPSQIRMALVVEAYAINKLHFDPNRKPD